MIRNPYGRPYQPRRLQFPVPEDIFASDDDVAERDEKEIRSPAIDRAIDHWNIAKEEGDEHGLRTAAKGIVDATSAAFKLQGVPTFAHPVLPPQFVKAEVASLSGLSGDRRNGAIGELLNLFDPSARPGGMQQFVAAQATPPSFPPLRPSIPLDPRSQATQPTAPWNRNDPLKHAPTWEMPAHVPPPRSPTWLERQWNNWFADIHEGPPTVKETPWDREYHDRAQSGSLLRKQKEFADFWTGVTKGTKPPPDEMLRRQLIDDTVRKGDQPVFLSPKAPHPDDPYKDRVSWPVGPNPGDQSVVVTGPFGNRTYQNDHGRMVSDFHPGTDFRNRPGEPVFSPKNGTILKTVRNSGGGGNLIYVLHDDGSISAFFHTGSLSGMQEGDEVYAGQHIGHSDGSGVGPPHTHYSYFPPGTPIDPRTGLPMRGKDDHDRNAVARTQVDTFGPQGPYHRSTRDRPPVFFKR